MFHTELSTSFYVLSPSTEYKRNLMNENKAVMELQLSENATVNKILIYR